MSEEGEPGSAPEPETGPVAHANQLRGARFKYLIGLRKTWAWILGVGLVLAIGFTAFDTPLAGLVMLALSVVVGIIVVFAIADNQAEDAFFDSYCETHGLTRVNDPDLAKFTPLLRKGDERETDEMFHGTLAPGVEGDLVLYTYTEVTHDHKGNRHEKKYRFTLVHVEMPEVIDHLPELRVQNKSGFKFLEGVEDKFRFSHERVTLESEAMRDRYEVFVAKQQDPVWVRRLFSPSFIVWLTDHPPSRFAFELEDGHFVAYVPKHKDDVEGLEQVTHFGCHVASRLLEEVAQTSPRAERETV